MIKGDGGKLEGRYMPTISKLATDLRCMFFLKNISKFYLFGTVIFSDMVLPGLKFYYHRGKDI